LVLGVGCSSLLAVAAWEASVNLVVESAADGFADALYDTLVRAGRNLVRHLAVTYV